MNAPARPAQLLRVPSIVFAVNKLDAAADPAGAFGAARAAIEAFAAPAGSAVVVELQQPLPLEPYAASRVGGALIVVDPASHRTSGALLVREVLGGDGAA
jgi:sulfate adenylyltransferase subunit 1 (EFTu-like GTPase family)